MVFGKNAASGVAGTCKHVERAAFDPRLRVLTVCNLRVDIVGFHPSERLRMAEIVTLAQNNFADDTVRDSLVRHFDAMDAAKDPAQHVVVDNEALYRTAQHARERATGVGNHIAAGVRRERDRQVLLVAGLRIMDFCIGVAGYGRRRQAVVAPHLCGCCHDHGLLAAAAAHGASPQIGN